MGNPVDNLLASGGLVIPPMPDGDAHGEQARQSLGNHRRAADHQAETFHGLTYFRRKVGVSIRPRGLMLTPVPSNPAGTHGLWNICHT